MSRSSQHDLVCPRCQRRETLTPDQLLTRLRAAGLLRRAIAPEPEEIFELAQASAARLACEACGHVGLAFQETVIVEDDDDDWGDPKPCERCRALIPAERLELFPNTTLCVACQKLSERGADTGPAEYCPRCGNVMQLRKARGSGIARYVMECPACRR